MARTSLIIGCCGFPVAKKKYLEKLRSVEIQQTFYELPSEQLLKKWRTELPDWFVINMKAWQAITHPPGTPTWRRAKTKIPSELKDRYGFLRTTKENLEAWDKIAKAAKILEARVVVIQTPPSFKCAVKDHVENARSFFSVIEKDGFVVGWEPRGDWMKKPECQKEVRKIVENTGIIHIVDPFKYKPVALSETLYFRLHGRNGEVNYRYKYSSRDFDELTNIIAKMVKSGGNIKKIYI
ncbi:MAG: DUF72 domain-containing protein, partial [Pyrodictiaceae archaeon]